MHILLVPSFYPSSIRPTTGIFFIDQVNALRSQNHQVGVLVAPRLYETLAYIRQNRTLPPTLEHTAEDEMIYRLHSMWVPRFFPLISAKIYESTGLKGFEQYVSQHGKPDIIHAHNIFYGGHMAVKIAEKYNIPTVLTEHSTNYLRGRIFLPGQHYIARRTLKQIGASFAVGQALADNLTQKYNPPNPIRTIANVVDTDYFVPAQTNTTFTFAAVGQLTKRKRFDLLIESFTNVFRNQPVKLFIGGGGAEFSVLKQLVESLNMTTQIQLLGHLSRPQVLDLFQKSHVVVSSSNIETFGVTLIEAMSCGKPVIATRSGGPEQFVTDQTGILIPIENQQALSNALQTMYQTYNNYDPSATRDYCIQNFSQSAIAKQLEAVYQTLGAT